ncbi:hypothetical protein BpHYR1_018486 [Brachionus plicatilis]|uniref:Uncharacterized protein n=1 Tax=Brachionus plicatilis TaxID=10195 RepID=A0A3M7P5I8_BRAPC|nr:hypothetical protein BpHYR1_018486 [Brachionus plicatilis]
MEHASEEVGIFKGFRVHKDSHGGLFLLKNHIRHYLNETDRHQIHFLDLEHMNQLPEGENILKLNEPRQVHKHDEEHRVIGIYTREGQFQGKEVFTGVYGGLYLLNNGKKIRLGNSDWNYVEDIDKEKDEKKKAKSMAILFFKEN